MAERKQFKVEDAQIMYRNFAGNERQFNPAGSRNFCVILDPDNAAAMADDGWYIRYTKPREEGDEPIPYIQVKINFDSAKPPQIVMIADGHRTHLDAQTVESLDYADIITVDLIANAYEYEVRGETGISAYLKTLYVVVQYDDLERKYAVHDTEPAPADED